MSLDPWTTDVRVRARNLKKGLLDAKELEKHLKDLPDAESKAETVSVAQPAVGSDDDFDDEDEGLRNAEAPVTKRDAKAEELPHIDFSTFVVSLSHSALQHLGDAEHPDGSTERHLPMARQTIDILGLLHDKTKGNLTGDEDRLLTQVLYDLRMRFVEVSQGS